MDPFSKRIYKQLERSSLHARQLNKNAMALLHKQLYLLERRQQQNARALMRSKQAILQELECTEEAEHERRDKPEDVPPRGSSNVQQRSLDQSQPSQSLSSCFSIQQKLYPDPLADSKFPHSLTSSSSSLTSDLPSLFSEHHHHHHNARDINSQQACRFRALSPLSPCPYFPCRRPLSYHYLKASTIPDVVQLQVSPEQNPTNSPANDLHAPTSTSSPSGKTSRTCTPSIRDARQKDGYLSPRTSINDRLKGLRQLVREMREKNEETRPRDWTTNYGDPVSRRLLRKPVVAVSDE